ncbi:MAG: hypothetical protein Q4A82_06215 [Corynebacterium sp.]|nr:hypothetical protein [Corynebacterium sp.]
MQEIVEVPPNYSESDTSVVAVKDCIVTALPIAYDNVDAALDAAGISWYMMLYTSGLA